MAHFTRLRTPMFGRPLIARESINWPRLLFRYTDPKAREQIASLQTKFNEVQSLHSSLPKKIDEVDWTHWRTTIKTKGVVDTLEKEYKAAMSKVVTLNESEVDAKKRAQAVEVKALEDKASVSNEFLTELKDEISWTEHWMNHAEDVKRGRFRSWNRWKRTYRYPAYKIHRVNRVLFLGRRYQRAGRPVNKIHNIDLVELRKQIDAGNIRAAAGVVAILNQIGSLQGLQRPFIKKWIKPTDYEEAFRTPTNSLAYRAFALKNVLAKT
jgi:hypothetical protein